MAKITKQMQEWASNFGEEYTDRNTTPLETIESTYQQRYGLTRTKMNLQFVGGLDKDIKMLEVGSNTGGQLICLQKMGFKDLCGIELQPYAVELAKNKAKSLCRQT